MSHTRFLGSKPSRLEQRYRSPLSHVCSLPSFPYSAGHPLNPFVTCSIPQAFHTTLPCVPLLSQTRKLLSRHRETFYLTLFGGAKINAAPVFLIHESSAPPATPSIYISGAFRLSRFARLLASVSGLYCRRTLLSAQLLREPQGLSRALCSLLTVFTVVAILGVCVMCQSP